MMSEPVLPPSPNWSWTTKLVIALSIVAVLAFLLVRFQGILGPLLMAFILAYLIYPLAVLPCKYLHLPWRISVTLIYFIFFVILGGLLTWGGLTLFEQVQNLISFLQNAVNYLPTLLNNLSTFHYSFGPLVIDFAHLDIPSLIAQVMSTVQGLLGQIGTVLAKLATGAAGLVGWLLFILVVSYFMLVETGGAPDRLIGLSLPGYDADFKRMGKELSRIWNAFLRGQLICTGLTVLGYTLIFGIERMPYYLGLAVLAGLCKFVPYVGPLIAWTTFGMVAFFQGTPPFGLTPIAFAGIVVAISIIYDNMFDNLVAPRIIAQALRVHPAAVLIAALIAVNMIGLIGVILAAPVLATLKLFTNYAVRKLFDQDPWGDVDISPPPKPASELYPWFRNSLKVGYAWFRRVPLSWLFRRA